MDSGPLLAQQSSNVAAMSADGFTQLPTDESVEPRAQQEAAGTEPLLNQSLELQPMSPSSAVDGAAHGHVDEDAKIAQLKAALAEGVRARQRHVCASRRGTLQLNRAHSALV